MPSLDEYYRYIDAKGASSAATAEKPGASSTVDGEKGRKPGSSAASTVTRPLHKPGVRYVLKNGMTVAVQDEAPEEAANGEGSVAEIAFVAARTSLPATAPAAFLTEAQTDALTAAGVAADTALWQRLPRHLQTLARLTNEDEEEEVARKYYSRGFKESRRQLIERLLDPTLTLEETARVLGVCPATVRRYTNRGVLPHHRTIGQQRRFRLSDVLSFMEIQEQRKNGSITTGKNDIAALTEDRDGDTEE